MANKSGTSTGTGTKTGPTLEQRVREATTTWVKAETSALWTLVKVVWDGVQDVDGPDRKLRITSIKMWINQTLEEVHGPGGAADRDAHVSKIIKIGTNASPADIKRYEDHGIGFYKAYQEWSTPTPAKTKEGKEAKAAAKAAAAAGPTPQTFVDPKTGEPVAHPPEGAGLEGKIPVNPDAPGTADQKTATTNSQQSAAPVVAPHGRDLAPDPDIEVTRGWAIRIKNNRQNWSYFVNHMTTKNDTIINGKMVLELVGATIKKKTLFTDTIMQLLGDGEIRKEICAQILGHAEQFQDLFEKLEKAEAATK